jgi:hypothetical protein
VYCRERTVVAEGDTYGVAVSLPCNSLTCDYCRQKRRRQLINLILAGRFERLVTYTSNPNVGTSPLDRACRLVNAHQKLAKRIRRLFGEYEYLAILEATEAGEPHLHVLQRGAFIPQQWLSDQMAELVGARIVDIRRAYSRRKVAEYAIKHVGEASHRFGTLKRYWRSKNWIIEEPKSKASHIPVGDWTLSPHALGHFVRQWRWRPGFNSWHGRASWGSPDTS